MDPWHRLIDLGRAQRGVVAVHQATACGITRSTLDRRVASEGWRRPFPGVAILPGRDLDDEVLSRAAALSVGDHAVITGLSALHLQGAADGPPVRPHLVVPAMLRPRLGGDVRITRSRTLTERDGVLDHGVRVAVPARALLDAAAFLGRERLRALLIDARQRRVVEVAEVAERAGPALSVPGRGRLLAACRDVDVTAGDSVLAAEVERRLRLAGFVLDVPARRVPTPGRMLTPDLTVAGKPVAIEVDGFGTHSSRTALDLDQRKHNAYVLAGWIVLRIGWVRLVHDWDGFVAELRAAIRQVSH